MVPASDFISRDVIFAADFMSVFDARNGLDDYSLRCVSNGEFQTIVFVKSISEAVFVSNLLRHIRQERIDLDAVAAHMHSPAPPDKHKESARFMQSLLGEIVSTIKTKAPPSASSSSQSPEAEQLAKAKRKLEEAGIDLTPVKDKQPKSTPSSQASTLPTAAAKTPAEQILEKELTNKPGSVPSSSSQDAVDKWLKKHQGQLRGKAAAFKKHVAEVLGDQRQSPRIVERRGQVSKDHALAQNIQTLGALPLSCESFMLNCEQWLKKLILQYKYLFPSFHVPKNSLREAPHQSIKKFLHNFQVWEETMWEPDFRLESVPCPRAKYRNQLPESCFSSGHVAAGLDNFQSLLPGCSSILSASAASTFFPGRNHWLAKSRALFDQWLKRHRLPNTLHPMFEDFCKEQWQQHVGALEHSSRLNWAMLQQVKSTLQKDFVLYNVLVFYFVDCAPHGMPIVDAPVMASYSHITGLHLEMGMKQMSSGMTIW
ncbi:hypothetical protein AK812_SmicGene25069 [Symbiodinium microadriaticum]|uniref:Uncharacterized protein n=1 Tax=Symbiodinium microadriaticum TaxID=2951 RepID=A0A1Q9DCX6_SYMMI|nr:hypothetical protein AK812_SmicGene25069 [Symbiodinium microadriaticum]